VNGRALNMPDRSSKAKFAIFEVKGHGQGQCIAQDKNETVASLVQICSRWRRRLADLPS
jgi:hypothetical protein